MFSDDKAASLVVEGKCHRHVTSFKLVCETLQKDGFYYYMSETTITVSYLPAH